jgi:hypothetical protein
MVPIFGYGRRIGGNMVAAVDDRIVLQDRDVAVFADLCGDRPAGVAAHHIEFRGRCLAPGQPQRGPLLSAAQ